MISNDIWHVLKDILEDIGSIENQGTPRVIVGSNQPEESYKSICLKCERHDSTESETQLNYDGESLDHWFTRYCFECGRKGYFLVIAKIHKMIEERRQSLIDIGRSVKDYSLEVWSPMMYRVGKVYQGTIVSNNAEVDLTKAQVRCLRKHHNFYYPLIRKDFLKYYAENNYSSTMILVDYVRMISSTLHTIPEYLFMNEPQRKLAVMIIHQFTKEKYDGSI